MNGLPTTARAIQTRAETMADRCDTVRRRLQRGLVIPAHPLALTAERKLDERRQRALSRYYIEAGSGGLAWTTATSSVRPVGATTQLRVIAPSAPAAAGSLVKQRSAASPWASTMR